MRISPYVLLFILSSSFVAGITIIDVPSHDAALLTTRDDSPSSDEVLNDYTYDNDNDDDTYD